MARSHVQQSNTPPPVPDELERLARPFYDTDGLCPRLNTTAAVVAGRTDARQLLRLRTGDGTPVYPTGQFTAHGASIVNLNVVLDTLADGTDDPWTWALWLTTPKDDWNGEPAWNGSPTANPKR